MQWVILAGCVGRRDPGSHTPLSPAPPPQSKLHMEGFRSLKEGEAVEFTFKKSAKGLESLRVTGPGGVPCVGSERRPKGKSVQKRRSKGDRVELRQGDKEAPTLPKTPKAPERPLICISLNATLLTDPTPTVHLSICPSPVTLHLCLLHH
ncbi:hypothetical protein MATL_G00125250 [Megalops atlanticus]|uniref:CSD domain-containing protein n=1 Tax=Megalops atlanticus TaxID=7932 RepID=A0A9D3TBD6_MEGAT|nr:hypothetical protein MATL_G00125250 [Megalops atlanticus]